MNDYFISCIQNLHFRGNTNAVENIYDLEKKWKNLSTKSYTEFLKKSIVVVWGILVFLFFGIF